MTSRDPDTGESGDGNDFDSTPKTPRSLLRRHLPEAAADDVLSSTGFRSARFTERGGEARQGALLH